MILAFWHYISWNKNPKSKLTFCLILARTLWNRCYSLVIPISQIETPRPREVDMPKVMVSICWIRFRTQNLFYQYFLEPGSAPGGWTVALSLAPVQPWTQVFSLQHGGGAVNAPPTLTKKLLAVPRQLTVFTSSCMAPTSPVGTYTPGIYLETGSPGVFFDISSTPWANGVSAWINQFVSA